MNDHAARAAARRHHRAPRTRRALPGQLFSSTQIPVCLGFLAKNKNDDAKRGFRNRRQHTLFIDARCRSRVEHEAAA